MIFELVKNNRHLTFVDASSGDKRKFCDLRSVSLPVENKSLVFIYLDDEIEAIELFWSAIKDKHCIGLFPKSMNGVFKNDLESKYEPDFIYDPTRLQILHYNAKSLNGINIFQKNKPSQKHIHADLAVMLSTSGSTGSPKLVKLSENNLVSNSQAIIEYLPVNSNDVVPLNLPVCYSYGLSVLLTNSIAGGEIVSNAGDMTQKSFWENFEKYGFTSFAGVPFTYEILSRIGFLGNKYPSLKYFTQAGGKLRKQLVERFALFAKDNNVKFYVMYGATEATARMAYLEPELASIKSGSIGKAISGGDFKIDHDSSELLYRGPNVFGGYAQSLKDIETYTQIEWLNTGDIARVDDEGFFYITGRKGRFIKINGTRINLSDIEHLIDKQFNLQAYCIGIEDKKLVVFFRTDTMIRIDELKKWMFSVLKIHPGFIEVRLVDDFPVTLHGKINYHELIESFDH